MVFFSHPADFTPVCTTEFLAFTQSYPKFKELGCELLGLSVDSNTSHLAWIYNIYQKTGIQIPFPLIADMGGEIARKYGMISDPQSKYVTVRCAYIIDPQQIIRAIIWYPLSTGRCIPEILRAVEALQLFDSKNLVTPANWNREMAAMVPPPKTYDELQSRVNDTDHLCCMDWYLCFRDPDR